MVELNRLILADCMDVMKEIPDKYFELAIVDPPYGININKSGRLVVEKGWKYKDWDNKAPDENYFSELLRVSQNQIICGANHFISKIPFDSSCWIIWDKQQPEGISFASAELFWTSFKTVTKTFYWHPQTQNGDRIHPTQKPIPLYKWLLKNYAKQGDKILDTHAGSCSSVIACLDMGFEYLAIEKDEEYFIKAIKRIEDYKAQTNLFKEHLTL